MVGKDEAGTDHLVSGVRRRGRHGSDEGWRGRVGSSALSGWLEVEDGGTGSLRVMTERVCNRRR